MKQQEINKLLEAYYSGTISSEDRRRLELQAMDDPFLFDALEGGSKEAISTLDPLRARLHNRVKKKKRRVLWLPAVAACLLLISAVFLWNNFGDLNESSMAKTMEAPVAADQVKEDKILDESPAGNNKSDESAENEILEESFSEEKKLNANNGKLKPKTKPSKEIVAEFKTAKPSPPPPPPAVVEDEIMEDEEFAMEGDLVEEYSSEPNVENTSEKEIQVETMDDADGAMSNTPASAPVRTSSDMPSRKAEKLNERASAQKSKKRFGQSKDVAEMDAEVNQQKKVSGIVLEERGDAIIGANIFSDDNNGTVTDYEGKFTFLVNNDISEISINYLGYEPKTITLTQDSFYRISLNESQDILSEVVVSGYGSSSSTPEMGWTKFNQYISQNNQLTPQAKLNNINGVVRLSFTVDEKGKPTNFKIIETPGFGLDQKAIQLIINSGKWSPGEVTYEIEFN